MNKAINSKHSTLASKETKDWKKDKHCINDQLAAQQGICTFREIPLNNTIANNLADEFIGFCEDEKFGVTIERFCKLKGIARSTFEFWCTKYPRLAAAKKIGKRFVGDNREVGAITKSFDYKAVAHRQHQYDEKYDMADKYQAALKKSDKEDSNQTIHVHLPENKRVIDKEKE